MYTVYNMYHFCNVYSYDPNIPRALGKRGTIHQVTTMLATSKNVLFPGHNHDLLTTCTDDPSLAGAQAIISVGSSVPVVMTWKYNIFRGG